VRDLEPRPRYRHFPVPENNHPRAWAAACAAEAARAQGAFWAMHEALFDDPARLEDPHLWERARRLGLDLGRFEADRRSDAVAAAVARDVEEARHAGVSGTPAVFVNGERRPGWPDPAASAP
jgi:protein-disulfide isomerase